MESFVRSLGEDTRHQDLDSDENQFVLALAGIVTSKSVFYKSVLYVRTVFHIYCKAHILK